MTGAPPTGFLRGIARSGDQIREENAGVGAP
jgi:hypothetical protein